jgi:hypothetical protein
MSTVSSTSEPKSQVARQIGEMLRTARRGASRTGFANFTKDRRRKRNAEMESFQWMGISISPLLLMGLAWALMFLLYLTLQVWFGYVWSGRWRIAALVPLVGLAALMLFVYSKGPYHPNMPDPPSQSDFYILTVLFFLPLGVLYLAITGIAHRVWG